MIQYAKYKPSDLWFGDIPDHWKLMRCTNYCYQNKRKNNKLSEKNLLSLSYGQIKRKDIDTSFGLLPSSFANYQIIDEGYIILRLTDLQNDKKSLRVGYAKEKGIITSAYLALVFDKKINSKFCFYLLYCYDINKIFYSQGGSMRQSMKFDDFKSIPLLIPPQNEQNKIVYYLDQKTTTIDKKISLLETKIRCFKELSKSLINESVCRGLNKNVPLNESGIEWIGKIPSHWVNVRGKNVFIEKSKKGYPNQPLLAASQKLGVVLKTMLESRSMEAQKDFENFKLVEVNDFVISLRSFEGGIETAFFKGIISPVYTVFHATKGLNIDYYKYLFKCTAFISHLQTMITGIRDGQSIKFFEIQSTYFPLPPFEEQKAIAAYLDSKTKIIESIIKNIVSQIDALKDLRKTLINDVVTGKLKVIE